MQKLFVSLLLTASGIAVLGGCPIYSDSSSYPVSTDNGGNCVGQGCSGQRTCGTPSDCPSGYNCGVDGYCHGTSCSQSGCPVGYTCHLANGTESCTADTSSPPLEDAGAAEDAAAPDDAGPLGKPATCATDRECSDAGAGAKCLDGDCVAAADQCTDSTQCQIGACVNGACTPSCDATHACPIGYACDLAKGVCTGDVVGCGGGASCKGSNSCVEDHCVAPCGAGGTCAAGLVCVAGGCIPEQKPRFVCTTDGKQDSCVTGSVCLHHSCYIGCDPKSATACKSADKYNQCKAVTTSSGAVNVCGSTANLGTECDPTQNKACTAGKVCIDGFCR